MYIRRRLSLSLVAVGFCSVTIPTQIYSQTFLSFLFFSFFFLPSSLCFFMTGIALKPNLFFLPSHSLSLYIYVSLSADALYLVLVRRVVRHFGVNSCPPLFISGPFHSNTRLECFSTAVATSSRTRRLVVPFNCSSRHSLID